MISRHFTAANPAGLGTLETKWTTHKGDIGMKALAAASLITAMAISAATTADIDRMSTFMLATKCGFSADALCAYSLTGP